MNVMSYFVESTICSAIFAAYYLCFLRNGLFYGWNRCYLLLSAVVSLVIPLIHINIPMYVLTPELPVIAYEKAGIVEIPILNPVQQRTSGVDLTDILFAVYGLSLLGLIVFELRNLWKINLLKKGVSPLKINNVKVYTVDSRLAPFSLFNTIFWRNEIDINSSDGQRILQHELLHIKAYHSCDKLFMQLLCTVFWMNPVFWLLKRELSMVHEYAADNACIEDDDTQRLSALILCSLYPNHFLEFTNNFFQSNIKRRIVMLSRKFKKQKFPLFRRLMVIIPVTLALAVFTVHIEAKSMHVQDVVSYKDAIVKPLFNDKNSENNFANWILSCLDYPQNAREQGIDGVVAISFIIDTDGSVKNTTVTNQINSMLSDELVGHVNQSPKWTPGKDAAGNPIPVSHTFSAYFRIEYPKDESYAIASDKVEKLSEEIKNADVILVAVGKNASEALEKHNRVSFSIDESGSLSDIKLETEPLPGDFLPDGSDKAEKNPNENKDVIKVAFKKAPVINDTVYAEHFAVCGGFEFDEGINDTIYVKPPDELQKSEGSKNKEIVVVAFGTEKKAASDKAKENQCLGMNFTPDRRDSVKKTVTNIDTVPFSDVEEKPKFQGKDADAFVEYVYSQIVYPTEAIAKNIEGNVRIVFIINEDGSLSDIKSVKEVDPLLENVVLGIVEKSPKWTPGKHKNKLVKVTYQIPVIFKLSK